MYTGCENNLVLLMVDYEKKVCVSCFVEINIDGWTKSIKWKLVDGFDCCLYYIEFIENK